MNNSNCSFRSGQSFHGTRLDLSESDTVSTRSRRTSFNHDSAGVRQPMNAAHLSFNPSFFARRLAVSLVLVAALAMPTLSWAASATWNGTADATWSNNANWSASPAPGINDTATFSGAGNNNTNIDLTTGVGVTISNIVFDTSSAAAYTIGIGALGSQSLTQQVNGAITVNSTVIKPQLFNASIALGTNGAAGPYSLVNNSGQLLTSAGGITGGTG